MTPIRPEAYGALSLARKHAELSRHVDPGWYPSWRSWRKSRRSQLRGLKHAAKAQKLLARARRFGWDGPLDPDAITGGARAR